MNNNNIGMMILYQPFSIYSLCMALLWTGIFIMSVHFLMKNSFLLKHFSIYTLSLLLAICIIRILLPFELPYIYILKSNKILPAIQKLLTVPIIQSSYITIDVRASIIILWVFVAMLLIIKNIKIYLRFKHALDIMPASTDRHLYNILAKADIHNNMVNVKIITLDSVKSPVITGLAKPVIILPDINFSDDELLGIFMHEISHYKSKHCLIKLTMEFICAVFWWNPLFKKLATELAHAMELHSDRAVCLNLDRTMQKEYLQGIAKVASNINTVTTIPPCSCSIVEEDNGEKLIQRFKMIAKNSYRDKKKLDLIAIPLIIAAFLFSYSFTLTSFNEPSIKDIEELMADMLGEEYNGPNTGYLIETEHGYSIYNSSDTYAGHITIEKPENLNGIEVYKSMAEAEKERQK